MTEPPHLHKIAQGWELLVDGKPYLILGAELQNSSMSSARYMDTVWQKIADMGVNTVLGAVAWEDIEVEEGQYQFSELDLVIRGAASHGLRLIITWFGAFKNGMSSYAPAWVKKNPRRFPRMQIRGEDGSLEFTNVLSILHGGCAEVEARAFAALMGHLCDMDEMRTVIMVQVENEVGLLGDSRDRSSPANTIYASPVPKQLVNFLTREKDSLLPDLTRNFSDFGENPGSWPQYFGETVHAEELFMAYHYALYVNKVAAAGKKRYNIPLFTNVWLPRPGKNTSSDGVVSGGGKPGDYPSGGAVPAVLDIWKRFAPALDFIAPDIYSTSYSRSCATYALNGRQPLFIPEQHRTDFGARRIWEAIGLHGAIGASPFGIDTIAEHEAAGLKTHYTLLGSMASRILESRRRTPAPGHFSTITGFFFDEYNSDGSDPSPSPVSRHLGDYELQIYREFVFGVAGPGFGIIVALASDIFLLVGMGFRVEFKSTPPAARLTGILRFEEKSVVDKQRGMLRTERKFNGDETRSGRWANMPTEKPDCGFIPITIPARTMIGQVHVYSLGSGEF
ncbi:glycoside hydrolase superfamily [Aspergillus pseudodeflectus]|uniref:Glycoside hydrolase superfamily n=1 Tax=Aspergillus pseudodeflectus TaxID=176178 RepID=A0ABR4JH15_9EURO